MRSLAIRSTTSKSRRQELGISRIALPPELLIMIVEALAPSNEGQILPRSHENTEALLSCCRTCRLLSHAALKILYQHCVYLDTERSAQKFSLIFMEQSLDTTEFSAASYAQRYATQLYLAPFSGPPRVESEESEYPIASKRKLDIDSIAVTSMETALDIRRILAGLSSSVRRLIVHLPLEALSADLKVSETQQIVWDGLQALVNLEEFINLRDQCPSDLPLEDWWLLPSWATSWNKLRFLCLYNQHDSVAGSLREVTRNHPSIEVVVFIQKSDTRSVRSETYYVDEIWLRPARLQARDYLDHHGDHGKDLLLSTHLFYRFLSDSTSGGVAVPAMNHPCSAITQMFFAPLDVPPPTAQSRDYLSEDNLSLSPLDDSPSSVGTGLDVATICMISHIFRKLSTSLRRLTIDMPLRELCEGDDVFEVRPILRKGFEALGGLVEFTSVRDELYINEGHLNRLERLIWANEWSRLRFLCLYNPYLYRNSPIWSAIAGHPSLETAVFTNYDGWDGEGHELLEPQYLWQDIREGLAIEEQWAEQTTRRAIDIVLLFIGRCEPTLKRVTGQWYSAESGTCILVSLWEVPVDMYDDSMDEVQSAQAFAVERSREGTLFDAENGTRLVTSYR